MTTVSRSLVAGFCPLVLGALLTSVYLSRPPFVDTLDTAMATGVSIAPVDQALTLARYRERGGPRVLLVRSYEADTVGSASTLRSTSTGPRLMRWDCSTSLLA